MILNVIFAGLIITAVIFDLKERRIPNWIIITGLAAVLLYHLILGNYNALWTSLNGLMAGILLLIIPFLAGGIGAGDVKLLGMVGAFKGTVFVFNSFIWMALIGGIIAVILLIKQHRFTDCLARLGRGLLLFKSGAVKVSDTFSKKEFSSYFPYGVAIALGVLAAFVRGWC